LLGNGDIKFKRILPFSRIKFLTEKAKATQAGGFYNLEPGYFSFLIF
jgi:hypothetical protein